MADKLRVLNRVLALLLTFVMFNVCVLFSAGTTRAASNTGEVTSNKLLVGRLAVAERQSIYVNGNEAGAGTSIFSGMRLQAPEGVNAAVQLGSLGRLTIEPNTDLTLDFTSSNVEVKVTSGEATLTTNTGISGTLTTADGNVLRSDGAKTATLMSKNSGARALTKNQKAAAIILPIVAAVIIIAIVVAQDDDESPSNP
jgi:hypothetical protein